MAWIGLSPWRVPGFRWVLVVVSNIGIRRQYSGGGASVARSLSRRGGFRSVRTEFGAGLGGCFRRAESRDGRCVVADLRVAEASAETARPDSDGRLVPASAMPVALVGRVSYWC